MTHLFSKLLGQWPVARRIDRLKFAVADDKSRVGILAIAQGVLIFAENVASIVLPRILILLRHLWCKAWRRVLFGLRFLTLTSSSFFFRAQRHHDLAYYRGIQLSFTLLLFHSMQFYCGLLDLWRLLCRRDGAILSLDLFHSFDVWRLTDISLWFFKIEFLLGKATGCWFSPDVPRSLDELIVAILQRYILLIVS